LDLTFKAAAFDCQVNIQSMNALFWHSYQLNAFRRSTALHKCLKINQIVGGAPMPDVAHVTKVSLI
jgi:hypothetical protein